MGINWVWGWQRAEGRGQGAGGRAQGAGRRAQGVGSALRALRIMFGFHSWLDIFDGVSLDGFENGGDALASADAEGDEGAFLMG